MTCHERSVSPHSDGSVIIIPQSATKSALTCHPARWPVAKHEVASPSRERRPEMDGSVNERGRPSLLGSVAHRSLCTCHDAARDGA